jgi:hypothetical protein
VPNMNFVVVTCATLAAGASFAGKRGGKSDEAATYRGLNGSTFHHKYPTTADENRIFYVPTMCARSPEGFREHQTAVSDSGEHHVPIRRYTFHGRPASPPMPSAVRHENRRSVARETEFVEPFRVKELPLTTSNRVLPS